MFLKYIYLYESSLKNAYENTNLLIAGLCLRTQASVLIKNFMSSYAFFNENPYYILLRGFIDFIYHLINFLIYAHNMLVFLYLLSILDCVFLNLEHKGFVDDNAV